MEGKKNAGAVSQCCYPGICSPGNLGGVKKIHLPDHTSRKLTSYKQMNENISQNIPFMTVR